VLAAHLGSHETVESLYFDGSSAANFRDAGTLEAQDLFVWGKFDPERWVDERERIDDLCA
jgi:hypothetical protein